MIHNCLTSCWRPFSWVWWKHWLSPFTYLYRVKELYQRAIKGYADPDLWSLDNYLSSWLPQALNQFRKTVHGHPCLASCMKDGKECVCTPEDWDAILEKMEDGFIAAQQIIDWPPDDWDEKDNEDLFGEKYKAVEARFHSGMELFTKYFFGIWD